MMLNAMNTEHEHHQSLLSKSGLSTSAERVISLNLILKLRNPIFHYSTLFSLVRRDYTLSIFSWFSPFLSSSIKPVVSHSHLLSLSSSSYPFIPILQSSSLIGEYTTNFAGSRSRQLKRVNQLNDNWLKTLLLKKILKREEESQYSETKQKKGRRRRN